MSILGILAGGIKGGADAAGDVSRMEYQGQQKLDYAKQLTAMEEQKLLRIEQARRAGVTEDIGLNAQATAKAAPVVAEGLVAGQIAGANATKNSQLPKLLADVEEQKFEANKSLDAKKAVATSENTAKAKVAETKVPGYAAALTLIDYANSAGERSVAGINAGAQRDALYKPTIQSDSEGNVYTATWDPTTKKTTTAALLGPDGKQIKGPKDLDQRTSALAQAMLAGIRNEIDPDAKKETINTVMELLTTGKLPGSKGTYKDGDVVNLQGGGTGTVTTVNGKQVIKPNQ